MSGLSATGNRSRPSSGLDEDEWVELVRDEVVEAVRRRLVADVPLGALLSGGIDSSIVVSQMAQLQSEPVRTFSVGFSDARYDEREYARLVARRYGTVHEEVLLEPDAAELLPRLAAAYDEPRRPSRYRLTSSREARAVTVAPSETVATRRSAMSGTAYAPRGGSSVSSRPASFARERARSGRCPRAVASPGSGRPRRRASTPPRLLPPSATAG